MFKGKKKCRILKQIRAEIAKNNGIDYMIEECKHKGDCAGTCPKCEAEVRELERQLAQRAALGRRVALVGVAAGIALTGSACGPDAPASSGTTALPQTETSSPAAPERETEGEVIEIQGDVAMPLVTVKTPRAPGDPAPDGNKPGAEDLSFEQIREYVSNF